MNNKPIWPLVGVIIFGSIAAVTGAHPTDPYTAAALVIIAIGDTCGR